MKETSSMGRQAQLDLLALCRLKGLSWYLIAREALRVRGLAQLLSGTAAERSKEAAEAKQILAVSQGQFTQARDEAAAIVGAAEARGASLTTVLVDDYPLNLRT